MNTGYRANCLGNVGPIAPQKIEAWRVSIPVLEPFRISSGEASRKDAIIVRLSDGHDFSWEESSVMPDAFYSAETPDTCERELVDRILSEIAGRSYTTVLALEATLSEWASSCFVTAAIETAAWELLARRAGKPLRVLFGIEDRPVLGNLAVGLYGTEEELHAALERYRVRDYLRLKTKIKHGYDVQMIREVRASYGDIPLCVDANADYSIADLDLFRELGRYNLMMFEQPFAADDFEVSSALQHAVRTPVCFDESIRTADDVRRAADLDACRIVNIKLQRVGGYLETLRIADSYVQNRIALWMGTMPELGVGSVQALMFGAYPGCIYPADVAPGTRWYQSDILQPELTLEDGQFILPKGPGLGFSVDTDALKRLALRSWSF